MLKIIKIFLWLAVLLLVILIPGRDKNALPETSTLSLIFMGDIMGHDDQIESAYNPALARYDYLEVFDPVRPIIEKADFAIANLEVTLAGEPYKGYPRFCSPTALASSCQKSGIDAFINANNHTCDRGKSGIVNTLNSLDSLGIKHTGVFRNPGERRAQNLMILEKNNIRAGILNYTYGTNGLRTPFPVIVNRIDTSVIANDIEASKSAGLDILIVTVHWGWEYHSRPNPRQKRLARFLFDRGVNIIIGSHPHVVQPLEYQAATDSTRDQFIAWSLGNMVSNMRRPKCDGGLLAEILLEKKNGRTLIKENGYHLIWVNKYKLGRRNVYEILPCAQWEKNNFPGLDIKAKQEMQTFIFQTRELFKNNNKCVYEWQ